MSVLGARSLSFSAGSATQGPSKQPAFSYGGSATPAANKPSFGLFGQPAQQQQPQQQGSGGLFGAAQNQQSSSNMFGGQQQQPAQQQGTSLFGGAQQQPQQPTSNLFGAQPQQQQPSVFGAPSQPAQNTSFGAGASTGGGGGLFGAQPQQQQQQPAATGLFGTQQQQQPSTGLFGQQQQQQPSTGLFGSQQPQQPSTGLFGAQPQQQQQPSTGGLFGQQQQQQPTTGLFGQQPQQQQSGGLFGGSTGGFGASFGQKPAQPASGGLFGGGAAGASQPATGFGGGASFFSASQPQQQQQQQQQPQEQQSPFARYPYYSRERFNDLPEEARKLVEELDSFITQQQRTKEELQARDHGSAIAKTIEEAAELTSVLASLSASLELDAQAGRDTANRIEEARYDNTCLYETLRGQAQPTWPKQFFSKAAERFKERIERYRATMEQIERHLSSLDKRQQHSPQAISDVMQAQHASFMALAGTVATLHGEVDTLKRDYARWYREQYRSVRDPFAMGDLAI